MDNNTLIAKALGLAQTKADHARMMVKAFRELASSFRSNIGQVGSSEAMDAALKSMLQHAQDEEEYWDCEASGGEPTTWSPNALGMGTTLGD